MYTYISIHIDTAEKFDEQVDRVPITLQFFPPKVKPDHSDEFPDVFPPADSIKWRIEE